MNNPGIETLNRDPMHLKTMLQKNDGEIALVTRYLDDLQKVVVDLNQDRKVIQDYLSFGISNARSNEKPINVRPMADYYYC